MLFAHTGINRGKDHHPHTHTAALPGPSLHGQSRGTRLSSSSKRSSRDMLPGEGRDPARVPGELTEAQTPALPFPLTCQGANSRNPKACHWASCPLHSTCMFHVARNPRGAGPSKPHTCLDQLPGAACYTAILRHHWVGPAHRNAAPRCGHSSLCSGFPGVWPFWSLQPP